MSNILNLLFIFIVTILIIYFIVNKELIINFYNKIKTKNVFCKILVVLVFIVFIIFLIYNFYKIYINFYYAHASYVNNKYFEIVDESISTETQNYYKIKNNTSSEEKYKEPYIPEGFSYVEGEWNTGYIIEDENQNQYVWVPCSNIENDEVPVLEKNNFTENPFVSKDDCYDLSYEEFIKSAFENGGFYISRYEIGIEEDNPVSKANVEIYKGVTRDEAKEILDGMYENINCELINGFAYDTTLTWFYNSSENVESDSEDITYTGKYEVNHIFDLLDKVLEMTNEVDGETIVVRGLLNLSGMEEFDFEDGTRFLIFDTDTSEDMAGKLAFRSILYK